MKLFMSRAQFERIAAGLSPVERDRLLDAVHLYPEDLHVEWHVDQDRIGVRYEQLMHDQQQAEARLYSGTWHVWPRRNGKASFQPGPPWQQTGPGVWTAPAGTPLPGRWPWLDVEQMVAEFVADLDTDRLDRYFLNDVVVAQPSAELIERLSRAADEAIGEWGGGQPPPA